MYFYRLDIKKPKMNSAFLLHQVLVIKISVQVADY